jgi:outer membrane lipoprotein-sorting protein
MKWLMVLCLALAGSGSVVAAVSEEQLALLRDAEAARGDIKGTGIAWVVEATSEEKGEDETMKLRVVTQASKVFAEILEPEKSKGLKYIVSDGKMWYHRPNLSRPVPISRRQRVIGRAAVGDIAAMSFLDDYTVTASEKGEHAGDACLVFDLEEKSKEATYPRIRYWVSTNRRVGIKAEFYTVSGARLRTATMKYENKLEVEGQARTFLSEMVVVEELGTAKATTLVYREHALSDFPDELFDYTKLGPGRKITAPGRK